MSLLGDTSNLAIHKISLNLNLFIGIGGTIVFGIADLLIGVMILKTNHSDSAPLKLLAIIMIIQGILEISIILSASLIIVFPLTMVLMTILFLSNPKELEVI